MAFPQESDLILRAQRGDEFAQQRLFVEWVPVVLRWANRLSGPKVDPDEVAADALERASGRLASLRDPGRFRAWLFQVTYRTVLAHRRRAWLRFWSPDVDVELAADDRLRPGEVELAKKVRAALEELPEKQRVVVVLCEVEGWTQAEAAEMLDVPLGTVKSRLRLGRERFRTVALRMGLDQAVS